MAKIKNVKRIISIALVLVTILSIFAISVSSASTTGFDILSSSKYAKTYTLSSSGKTIPYTSKKLSTRGTVTYGASSSSYIDNSSDEIYIFDVGCTNRKYWAYVSYPTSSRRVNAYIYLSALTKNNGNHNKSTSSGKFYCSTRKNNSINSSYYVANGDTVYLVATSSSKYQILYPISGGKWRLAWCNKSDYQKYCTKGKEPKSTTGLTDVTSYFAGQKITIKSVQNGKYICADADVSNTPLMANRSKASTWETFTVTSLTSDGWVGFKSSTNGKYLTAHRDVANTPVRASASKLKSWECFRIYRKGSDYYIKSQANSMWLSVRIDENGSPVRACVSNASTWERLSIKISDGYDAKKAAEYAVQHAHDTPVYSGSDCARYVSECLAVGGVSIPNKNLYSAGDYTYSGRKFTGYRNPYINAPALLTYLSTKYQVIKNPSTSQMEVGDVAFLVSSDGYYDGHAVMITKISNGIAYYSGHTKAQANQRIDPDNYWTKVRYLIKIA